MERWEPFGPPEPEDEDPELAELSRREQLDLLVWRCRVEQLGVMGAIAESEMMRDPKRIENALKRNKARIALRIMGIEPQDNPN